MKLRSRKGMTLLELGVALAIMSIVATMIVPALVGMGTDHPRETGQEVLQLLRYSRRLAIDSNVNIAVILDPQGGYYRIDSSGVGGTGPVEEGQIDMLGMETMQTDALRLRYYFRPTGSALGDTVRVLGADSSVVLWVDPWSGTAHAGNVHLYNSGLFPK